MMHELNEPKSFYLYKKRNKDITNAINYDDSIEEIIYGTHFRDRSMVRNVSLRTRHNSKQSYHELPFIPQRKISNVMEERDKKKILKRMSSVNTHTHSRNILSRNIRNLIN